MGRLVSLEGGDRSGKSTQVRLLCEHLVAAGEPHVFLREPGGTAVGESLRALLLDPARSELDPLTELLLFAAARAQLVSEVIRPSLEAGALVVVDRYLDSTVAYQGSGLGLDRTMVDQVNQWATGGLLPDRTILFDADPAALGSRAREGSPDRIERRGLDFHRRVREGYLSCAARDTRRIKVIDGSRDPMTIHREVLEQLGSLLERK
ncbi:MAG: dTMP kinase [bacterium]|nr:dTMP kinase [bacterium]